MKTPNEPRYPRGPATVGKQTPYEKRVTPPYYKANTISPAPLRSVQRDETHSAQESDKS